MNMLENPFTTKEGNLQYTNIEGYEILKSEGKSTQSKMNTNKPTRPN